MATIMSAT